MGQGEEVKTRSDPQVEIQERGEIFFFYRPKVNREEAHSADDVQRMYIVLRPESGERQIEEKQTPDSGKEGAKSEHNPSSSHEDKGENDDENRRLKKHPEGGHGTKEVNIEKEPLLRFIVMGKKSLPDPGKKSRPFWGFVELVTTKIDDIKDALRGEEYDTATRGHRHKPSARALGEGVYRILRHKYSEGKKMHTHLVYKLELPPKDKENEPQEELNVEREGSFIIQIKSPEQGGGRSEFQGVGNKRKAVFPAHFQGQFGSKRFVPADPPDFLNYEGCEFLLISASDDIEEELGLELYTETEVPDPKCSDLVKTFGADVTPTAPLFEGTWC
ncbi:uncharacterized protein [Spinacia oleracea]|uniref:Uncharacterized protein isoform X2 n=1 Tax=Spinacia oleracea TaxID=3562 RepID=A0ABM3QQ21_SPIOL|nr:uncharacterized protein LOC110785599 isoform X2 [Spinacia oleracea]